MEEPSMIWRKSSYSSGNGGACVEVAVSAGAAGRVLIRDTTDRQGPVLTVSPESWARFTARVLQLR